MNIHHANHGRQCFHQTIFINWFPKYVFDLSAGAIVEDIHAANTISNQGS